MFEYDQSKLAAITEIFLPKLDFFLDSHKIDYEERYNELRMPCPIHDGDNSSAVRINIDTGNWGCYTKKCHKKFHTSIIGFVRAILSKEEGIEKYNFFKTLDYMCEFCGQKVGNLTINQHDLEKHKYLKLDKNVNRKITSSESIITRSEFQKLVEVPCEYYLKRGFSETILKKYDVGLMKTGEMQNRAVFPIYNEKYTHLVGLVGRDVDDGPKKWYNNFRSGSYLFNYWFAQPFIKKCGIAILVEGQGDCLKLEENNIKISLGLFGSSLSDEQMIILERSNIQHLVVLTDNDEAGDECRKQVREQCGRLYKLHFPNYESKDVGEMNQKEVESIRSYLKNI